MNVEIKKKVKEDILKNLYFRIARGLSLEVDFRSRIGTVIVKNKRIVSVGHNRPLKTHPMIRKYNEYKTIHAEIDCIIGYNRDLLKDAIIYVYREHKDGSLAMSRPCNVCFQILKDIGITKVIYTTENGIKEEKIK